MPLKKCNAKSLPPKPKYLKNPEKKSLYDSIQHMSFIEARRIRDPIYSALVRELFEEGCSKAANYFEALAIEENHLFKLNILQNPLKENKELLLKIHENVMLAEKVKHLDKCSGYTACLTLLHQVLLILLDYGGTYKWVLEKIFLIIIKIIETDFNDTEQICDEFKCRIFYLYGKFMSEGILEECYAISVQYYTKALILARGNAWAIQYRISDVMKSTCRNMHDLIAMKLTKTIINTIENKIKDNAKKLLLIDNAIEIISEVGTRNNNDLFLRVMVLKIELLMDTNEYKRAIYLIEVTRTQTIDSTFEKYVELLTKLILLEGECCRKLNQIMRAMELYRRCLVLSREYDMKEMAADALLCTSYLYMNLPNGLSKSRAAVEEAKKIYLEIKNYYKLQCCFYTAAQVQAKEAFPQFMALLRKSNEFCNLYKLREWSYLCRPFWKERKSMDFIEYFTKPKGDTITLSISSRGSNSDGATVGSSDSTYYGRNGNSSIEFGRNKYRKVTLKRIGDPINCLLYD